MKNTGVYLATILTAVLCISRPVLAYSGGDGLTEATAYQIANKADLLELADDTDNYHKYFILTENIDLAGETFYGAVIAPDTDVYAFRGTFNGNHHTIDHLKIQGVACLGLFGKLSNATVTNLVLQNVEIYGTNTFGSVAGKNLDGTISNCSVSGLLDGIDKSYNFGGLVGYNEGTITDCAASCTITGLASCYRVGGLAGLNNDGAILERCSSSGSLTVGSNSYSLGGLAGENDSIITSCNSGVSVTGPGASHEIGGLVGENNETIDACYSTGTVTGGDKSKNIGGLAGFNWENITNCQSVSVSVNGGTSSSNIGGLAGANYETITDCSASGAIGGGTDSDTIGGLVGYNYGQGVIANCTAGCAVTGSDSTIYMGGLVGENENRAQVTACRSGGTISGGDSVYALGGLVGSNSATITRSSSNATVIGSADGGEYGGLVGSNSGTITLSCASGTVESGSSADDLGGLIGHNSGSGTVTQCYSSTVVNGGPGANRVGGLIGQLRGGSVSNCYNIGPVGGKYSLGGLVGYFNQSASTLTQCYAAGTVTGQTGALYLGGLVGNHSAGTISNSLWDTQTTTHASAAGYWGGILTNVSGLTSEAMKIQSAYTAYGWDFLGETISGTNDVWRMCVDGVNYPKLTWQHVQVGDFACPNGVKLDDVARLSQDWMTTYSLSLYGADGDGDKTVNVNDLAIFAEHWLEGI